MTHISKGDVVFISDLHLNESMPEVNRFFISFLHDLIHKAKALYILGDFFAYWIGDDDQSSWINEIMFHLKSAVEQGLPIYFLHGNRDFLLGDTFFKKTKCQLLNDLSVIKLCERPVMISHGDVFCTLDKAYQRFKLIVRNVWVKKIFLLLPLRLRLNIANYLRTRPQKNSLPQMVKMDVVQEAINTILKQHQVHYLIHGHTHKPAIHQWQDDHLHFQRMVLGAWDENPYILIWSDAKKEFHMEKLSID